jgi:hypothetical protein
MHDVGDSENVFQEDSEEIKNAREWGESFTGESSKSSAQYLILQSH